MRHLGINIYFWKREAPRRLVTELLAPVLEELRIAEPTTHLWYTLFDARAPHLFAVISTPSRALRHGRKYLADRSAAYLRSTPIEIDLGISEIERRHRQCRGRTLSAVDAEPGTAEPNTFRVFEHAADRFPLSLAGDASSSWRLWTHSMDWVLQSLPTDNQTLAAARWIAAIHEALEELEPELAESFWRHYACSLVLPLAERLAADEPSTLHALPKTVGERNMTAFANIWALDDSAAFGLATQLVRELSAVGPTDPTERWLLLRDINHAVLAQLFQPVRLEIPLVLYAWLQSVKKERDVPCLTQPRTLRSPPARSRPDMPPNSGSLITFFTTVSAIFS